MTATGCHQEGSSIAGLLLRVRRAKSEIGKYLIAAGGEKGWLSVISSEVRGSYVRGGEGRRGEGDITFQPVDRSLAGCEDLQGAARQPRLRQP